MYSNTYGYYITKETVDAFFWHEPKHPKPMWSIAEKKFITFSNDNNIDVEAISSNMILIGDTVITIPKQYIDKIKITKVFVKKENATRVLIGIKIIGMPCMGVCEIMQEFAEINPVFKNIKVDTFHY